MPKSISETNYKKVIQNKHCCICGRKKTSMLCRTCKKENKLAGFCALHLNRHNTERCHDADFKHIQKVLTIKRALYERYP